MMGQYAFDRSWDREDERLAAVERELDPVSRAAARQLGVTAGWRCWEIGAGRGSMVQWLAGIVGSSGSVLATDVDLGGLADLARGNVAICRHDVEHDELPAGGFDLIHARLVLEHLGDPASAVRRLASALRPLGWLMLEDADGLLFEAEPPAKALTAIAGPWHRAARAAGWDPQYGRRLLGDLQSAGLLQVAGRAYRSYRPGGDNWASPRLGLERLRAQIQDAGASPADIDGALIALADPARIIVGGAIVTAWGQRAEDARRVSE